MINLKIKNFKCFTDSVIGLNRLSLLVGANGVGKSTVHSDVTKRLQRLDEDLYSDVAKILGNNLAERHIRGGESTRRRYRG